MFLMSTFGSDRWSPCTTPIVNFITTAKGMPSDAMRTTTTASGAPKTRVANGSAK